MTQLFIQSLTLAQFRSHKFLKLVLNSGPIAIHGANGAGKTNILEAVSLLSPGRGLRRAPAGEMARKPGTLGWKVSAQLHQLNQIHEVETGWLAGETRSTRIDGKAASQIALGRIARVLWLVPTMDRLWLEGAEGRRRFLDRMALSFEPGHAEAVLAYEKAMRNRNRLLKDQVNDLAWYHALEAQMADAGTLIHQNRVQTLAHLAAAQAVAETAFPTADLTLLAPDGSRDRPVTVETLTKGFADGRPRDMAAGRTLTGPHRTDLFAVYAAKSAPARECSTGEQKALLISLILANARALAQDFGTPPLLLLDEVAAHLDATRRAALFDEICALGAQAWMTGTGAELFSPLGRRAQYFELCDSGGISTLTEVFP